MKSLFSKLTLALLIVLFAGILMQQGGAAQILNSPSSVTNIPPGNLDPTFGRAGLVTTSINNVDQLYAIALQSDGKIVASARTDDSPEFSDGFDLVRYTRNGWLDPGFNGDGRVETPFGYSARAYALAVQKDGKIVAGGFADTGASFQRFAVVRYNEDGSLDTSFDKDGRASTGPGVDGAISALAIQPDGKIVAVGTTFDSSQYNYEMIAVVRFNADGSLDTSFDTDGIATTLIGDRSYGYSVAVQPDGKIIVGGNSYDPVTKNDLSIVRYNNDGSLDPTFDGDGVVTLDVGNGSGGHVAIQNDGRIVIAGYNYTREILVARYNENGNLDESFGTGGIALTNVGKFVRVQDISITVKGEVIVAGDSYDDIQNDFLIANYNANGSMNTGFAPGGFVITDFGSNSDDFGKSVALQTDGKIIVAGDSCIGSNQCDFALARYLVEELIAGSSNLKPVAAQDGWIIESGETTNKGGKFIDKWSTTLVLGDDAARKQVRSVLSFNTRDLPDNAFITKVILKLSKQGIVGGINPVNLFQGFMIDIRKGYFGSYPVLQASDFQAGAHKSFGPFKPALANGWYSFNLTAARGYINKWETNGGVTQIRLRFKLDDNNDAVANFLKLYSGNAPAASRPQLIVEYYAP